MKTQAYILLCISVLCVHAVTDPCDTDPCEKTVCPSNKQCRLMEVNCIMAPCPPIPQCVDIITHAVTAEACKVNHPVLGMDYKELFCGMGPVSLTCPDNTYCAVHPADAYAVCCYDTRSSH